MTEAQAAATAKITRMPGYAGFQKRADMLAVAAVMMALSIV
jgi:hypothetical protein